MRGSIHFFTENIQYKPGGQPKLRKWIRNVVMAENQREGEISFVFCDDEFLGRMNIKYLKHSTLTDIITFPLNENEGIVSGDIYISIPRVRENAVKYKEKFETELHRVMIHGILHLLGYKDSSKEDKLVMREKENVYLTRLFELVS